jgi:hypothetical protein
MISVQNQLMTLTVEKSCEVNRLETAIENGEK